MRIQTSKYYSDIWRNLSPNRSIRIHPIPFKNDKENDLNGLLIDTIHSVRPLNSISRLSYSTYVVSEKIVLEKNRYLNSSSWKNVIWIPAPWISKRAKDEYYQSAKREGINVYSFVETGFLALK
jgi:hypothetical protein